MCGNTAVRESCEYSWSAAKMRGAEVQRIRKGQILREICKENQKPGNIF